MKLSTSQLDVGYNKKKIIEDINLEIEAGQILTLIGPNGSGKSTILKTITNQIKSIGGTVFVNDVDITKMTNEELSKTISMVMTEKIKTELMTCRQIAATGRYPYTGKFGILSKEDNEKVDKALEKVNAVEVSDKDFMKISDGQRQRVMLARALCQDTDILILDEPTSYLDMRYKIDILTIIQKLAKEENVAIIMSLHELELAKKVSDKIACVSDGKISRIGEPSQIFSGNYIQKMYGVKDNSFDVTTGQIFLQGSRQEPKVFVIGGFVDSIFYFEKFQRMGIPFATGILWENSIEYPMAMATASKIISVPPFNFLTEESLVKAKKILEGCESYVCTLTKFTQMNDLNRQLLEYAKNIGKKEWHD